MKDTVSDSSAKIDNKSFWHLTKAFKSIVARRATKNTGRRKSSATPAFRSDSNLFLAFLSDLIEEISYKLLK